MKVQCKPCTVCYKSATVNVVESEFDAWTHGEHAQYAFPNMDADTRELLISGTHPDCWDQMWGVDV